MAKSAPIGAGESLVDLYEVIPPFAYAAITRSRRTGRMMYRVVEPPLTPLDVEALNEIKRVLMEMQFADLESLRSKSPEEVLKDLVKKVIKRYRIPVSEDAFDKIFYYVRRDMVGYGKLEVLMRDPNVEDVSCDGVGTPVYVWHSKYESLPTNIVFEDADELERVLVRLSHKAGKQISVAQPVVEGALPEGYRLHAMLSEVARKGGSFTVRKFREVPFSIVDLVRLGTISPALAAYLWLMVESKKSVMVVGATASGKTTTLNAIATFIRPEAKIVSIEDTPELNLPHENWVPLITRPSVEPWVRNVTLFDLLRSALRLRPDYIIVGEVRGEEAFTLFQAIATGHAGMCTLHAENVDYAVKRLISEPMNIPLFLIPLMNVFILIRRLSLEGRVVRRVVEVYEMLSGEEGKPMKHLVFKYDPVRDTVERAARSELLGIVAEEKFTSIEELEDELRRREDVIRFLADRGVTDFRRVSRLVRDYYLRPMAVYAAVERGVYELD